ncbi:MAG: chorismate-binding protein, partial [Herbaspirillum sp.]
MSVDPAASFALLDDADASSANLTSRLLTEYVDSLWCSQACQLPTLWPQLELALTRGLHAVALFDYELGAALHAIAPRNVDANLDKSTSRILLFRHCQRLSAAQVDAWFQQRSSSTTAAGIANLHPSVTEAEFDAALQRIHAYIDAGDVYQINYTYRLHFNVYGSPAALYARLRERQPVPYGALIMLPEGGSVLSLSPELLLRHEAGVLQAQPMKGTASVSVVDSENTQRAIDLAADPKNRAENLMIVDLLRNDLGRIAVPGSVMVPALFKVQRYGQVLQMTSTVRAVVRHEVGLADIFDAVFPCGSITGAPKRRALQIIRDLEPDPRGLYTGAIGLFEAQDGSYKPESHRAGDFCWSVPIRTLVLQPSNTEGIVRGQLGIGAGIVHDSDSAAEYRECGWKARFVSELRHDFELIETMRASRSDGCRYLMRHLQRLQASAQCFGFVCDLSAIRQRLNVACAQLPDGLHRLRLTLAQDGVIALNSAPLQLDLKPTCEPVKVLLAAQPLVSDALLLQHKTTQRSAYDLAWREAEAQG